MVFFKCQDPLFFHILLPGSYPTFPSALVGLSILSSCRSLPLARQAQRSLHPPNLLFLGFSSPFLCLNLRDYLISLLKQNCLPAGYLSSFLSGKELGMVGLTLDSTSYKLRPKDPCMFLSPGSGQSSTRLCSLVFANGRCLLGPWGSVD